MTKIRVHIIFTIVVTLIKLHMSSGTTLTGISPVGNLSCESEQLYCNTRALLNGHPPSKTVKFERKDNLQRGPMGQPKSNQSNENVLFKKNTAALDITTTTSLPTKIGMPEGMTLPHLAVLSNGISLGNPLSGNVINKTEDYVDNTHDPKNTRHQSNKPGDRAIQLQYIIITTLLLSYYCLDHLFRGDSRFLLLLLSCSCSAKDRKQQLS